MQQPPLSKERLTFTGVVMVRASQSLDAACLWSGHWLCCCPVLQEKSLQSGWRWR